MENMEFDAEGSAKVREIYRKQGRMQAFAIVKNMLKQFAVEHPLAPKELTDAEKYVVEGMLWVLDQHMEKENENAIVKNDGKACHADCSGRVRSATGETGGPDVGPENG